MSGVENQKERSEGIILFGHELGHILLRHFTSSAALSRLEKETAADRFAGCAAAVKGVKWKYVEGFLSRIRGEKDGLYPSRRNAIEAAGQGYLKCRLMEEADAQVDAQPTDENENQDEPARLAASPKTRVSSFYYVASDPGNPGNRYWKRISPNRWEETGNETPAYFIERSRIHYAECDGSLLYKIVEPKLEIFVPDRNCPTKLLMFRRKPSWDWIGLSAMKRIKG